MSADEANSAAPSGKTPSSEPRPSPTPNDGLSEPDFLDREAETAKAAVLRTLGDLHRGLASATDLRAWTREHPWLAIGIAALAGFAAATVAGAPAEKPPAPPESPDPRPRDAEPAQAPRPRASFLEGSFDWLTVPLSDLLKTAVAKFIATVRQAPAPSAEDPAASSQGPADSRTP